MIQEAIFKALLNSLPFIEQLTEKIAEMWGAEEDEQVSLIEELEPKIISMIDSRVHGLENRLSGRLDEIRAEVIKEIEILTERLTGPKPAEHLLTYDHLKEDSPIDDGTSPPVRKPSRPRPPRKRRHEGLARQR